MGGRVVESVADDFEVDVVGEGDGGPGVAEAVDGEPGERRLGVGLVVLVLFAEEFSAESFGVVAAAVFEAEDVVVVVVGGPEHGFLVVLDVSPFGEQDDGGRVEVEDVASPAFVAVLEDDVVVVVVVSWLNMAAVPCSRSMSARRRPRTSPRRAPLVAQKDQA